MHHRARQRHEQFSANSNHSDNACYEDSHLFDHKHGSDRVFHQRHPAFQSTERHLVVFMSHLYCDNGMIGWRSHQSTNEKWQNPGMAFGTPGWHSQLILTQLNMNSLLNCMESPKRLLWMVYRIWLKLPTELNSISQPNRTNAFSHLVEAPTSYLASPQRLDHRSLFFSPQKRLSRHVHAPDGLIKIYARKQKLRTALSREAINVTATASFV